MGFKRARRRLFCSLDAYVLCLHNYIGIRNCPRPCNRKSNRFRLAWSIREFPLTSCRLLSVRLSWLNPNTNQTKKGSVIFGATVPELQQSAIEDWARSEPKGYTSFFFLPVKALTGFEQLTTLLTGVVLGLSIAAPPGPVNATAAYEVGTKSWLSGWLVELGATTGDGIFFVLTYYGLTKLIAGGRWSQVLFLIGGLVLLFLSYSTIRHAKLTTINRSKSSKKSPYLLGLSVAMTNPYQIIWWITVGVGMVSNFGLSILFGLFTGILAWTITYTTVLSVGLSRYQKAYPLVIYASALILGAFGVWFLITALSNLF